LRGGGEIGLFNLSLILMPNEPAEDLLEDCHSFPRCRTGWSISPAVDYAKDIYSRLGVMRDRNAINRKDILGNAVGPEVFSYAGSDILCTIYVPSHNIQGSKDPGFIEVEDQLQTITVSSARSVMPVRRLGETNPAAYTRGSRTIAGSMVFTTGLKDAFVKMLAKSFKDGEPRNEATLFVDQIPKFSMIFQGHNELGGVSSAMLVNITLTNFGTTFSVDDIYTESTFTYVAEQYFPISDYGDKQFITRRLTKIMGQVFEESIESVISAYNEWFPGPAGNPLERAIFTRDYSQIHRQRDAAPAIADIEAAVDSAMRTASSSVDTVLRAIQILAEKETERQRRFRGTLDLPSGGNPDVMNRQQIYDDAQHRFWNRHTGFPSRRRIRL
jgi:hypothetical protein